MNNEHFLVLLYSLFWIVNKYRPNSLREGANSSALRLGRATYYGRRKPVLRVEPRPLLGGEVHEPLMIFRIAHERVDLDAEIYDRCELLVVHDVDTHVHEVQVNEFDLRESNEIVVATEETKFMSCLAVDLSQV